MQTVAEREIMQRAAIEAEKRPRYRTWFARAISAATSHWPEYLIEAACLGIFMVSACSSSVLLQHPGSIVRQMIPNAFLRRLLTGVAMGLMAIALIYSPWGKQSGAHLNPSVTLTFFRLGKIEPWDALFYVVAQFVGGTMGVLLSALVWGEAIAQQNVRYAVTFPGGRGSGVAFVTELVISLLMMTMILNVSNSARFARFTGGDCRRPGCDLHHNRVTPVRYEHEPGAILRVSCTRAPVEFPLDLFHRTSARHVAGSSGLPVVARQARGLLRETAPR